MEKAIAHIDFYPYGGNAQPGCQSYAINKRIFGACPKKALDFLDYENWEAYKTLRDRFLTPNKLKQKRQTSGKNKRIISNF